MKNPIIRKWLFNKIFMSIDREKNTHGNLTLKNLFSAHFGVIRNINSSCSYTQISQQRARGERWIYAPSKPRDWSGTFVGCLPGEELPE